MKILSIDWDYFFPDAKEMDWGANEKDYIFQDVIWYARAGGVWHDGSSILKTFSPTIPENFWSIVEGKPLIATAESHEDIKHVLKLCAPHEVDNLDAHHDYGYENDCDLNCGNWAYMFSKIRKKISRYRLYYPEWRKDSKELNIDDIGIDYTYGLPEPTDYDIVFLCRSGAWTPPWSDDKLMQFIDDSGLEVHPLMELRPRAFNMQEAVKIEE